MADLANDLIRSTLQVIRQPVLDQVLGSFPLTQYIRDKGQIWPVSGGHQIEVPVMFGWNPNFEWTDMQGDVKIDQPEGIRRPYFPWAFCSMGYSFPKHLIDLNRGKEQVIPILDSFAKQYYRTFALNFEKAILSDGSPDPEGTSGQPRIQGIKKILDNTYTSTNEYGGVDRSTAANSWWRVTEWDCGGDALTVVDLENALFEAGGDLETDPPDFAIVHRRVWLWLEAQLVGKVTYNNLNKPDITMNRPALPFHNIWVYPCSHDDFPVTEAHIFNSSYLALMPHTSNVKGLVTETIDSKIPGRNLIITQGWWKGQMVCTNLSRQVKVHNFTIPTGY